MSGRDTMFRRASPYNLEMVELAGRSCQFYITHRLLGLVADTVAYPLYQHLRPRIALPSWRQLLYAPRTIAGARLVKHPEVVGLAAYATILPLDGAELEVYHITPSSVGTLFTFDLDYRVGMQLLRGLPWTVLKDLSLWFARDQQPMPITIAEYLRRIALMGRLPMVR